MSSSDRRTDISKRWILETSYTFEAAHFLLEAAGKNGQVHGHSWRVVVRVQSMGLIRLQGGRSMTVMRQEALDALMRPIISLLDHSCLNHKLVDDTRMKPVWEQPTSEMVARWVGTELANQLPGDVSVERIRVEKAGAAAEYLP